MWGWYLNTSANEEIDQDRLHLRLSTLEVIATNHRVLLDGKLNQPCR
jgi:hypothetical protein